MPSLCLRGAKKDEPDSEGNVPLWNAIKLELFDIAETLVEQGADVDFWQFDDNKNVSFNIFASFGVSAQKFRLMKGFFSINLFSLINF